MAVDHRKGLPKRIREEEVRAGYAANTRSDRRSLSNRLKRLEATRGLANTGADKIRNNRQGIATRLADIESA
jgi:hypothetical protein